MVFATFILTPFYNKFVLDDSSNVPKDVERKFANDWMLNVPLWANVITHTLGYIYCLLLFSDNF